MQITSILIGGVELISVCRKDATEINIEANGKMSTARLEAIFDTRAVSADDSSKVGTAEVGTATVGAATLGLTLGVQQSVVIMGGATYLFSGFVARLTPQVISPHLIRYAIDCQDNNRLLDRAIVTSETYAAQSDEAILDDLFATYLPAITTTGVIGTSPETVLDSITFENLSLRACVDRICERTGAEWRLGFDGDLKYYRVGSQDGAFDFSDSADGSATEYVLQDDFGFQEEFSTPANSVKVMGYQAPKPDPVTLTLDVDASGDDGYVQAYNSTGWPPVENVTAYTPGYSMLMALNDTPTYAYSVGLVRFDTSAIPDDATVLSATLNLSVIKSGAGTGRSLGIDYYDSANWPIGTDDYTVDPAEFDIPAYTPTAFNWRDIDPYGWGSWGTIPVRTAFSLINLTNISKTGYTGFRMFLGASDLAGYAGNCQVSAYNVDEATVRYRPTLTTVYQQPTPAPIEGTSTDIVSIAAYGLFEKTITDNAVTTTGEADARAAVEVERYAYPRKSINCTYDRDGLEVGDTVHFVSSLLGIDDDFIVKRLRLRWPRTQDGTRYYAELGEARADLIEILRKGV